LPPEQCQQRILAQFVVVVEILVAQRQRVNPLRHHLLHRMPNQRRVPMVVEAGR